MSAPLPLSRKLLYAACLSLGTLALLLGGLELGLRLAGFGADPHLFRRARAADGTPVWRENRDVTVPYFGAALARRPAPLQLPATKAPGTFRIFVLGSSAAMGDPEPSFSLARVLATLLRAAHPEQRFEVVNAGLTAVNSHLVRGFAADCAALEPDLLVVYEGNNEVIGPFGPTGVFAPFLRSAAAVRAAVWLKGTRTGQLLSRAGRRDLPAEWGGMELFLRQQIPAGDPRLAAVRDHFRANLAAIAARAHAAGATTLLCTVATNQRDFAPFLSVDGGAERTYQAAQAALAAGRDAEAAGLFQQALDEDALRFRTDSALNAAIRAAASAPGARLVDVAAALAAQSPHGVCGSEFFLEHVHLTLRGTYAIARQLLPEIERELARRGVAPAAAPVLPYDEVSVRLGYSIYEQTMIAEEMVHRLGRPPFTGQSDHAARLARWQRFAEQGRALLARPEATDALQELGRRALAAAPDDPVLARNVGAMLVARGRAEAAVPLLARAVGVFDDDVDALVALGWALRAQGHAAESQAAFDRARALEPGYPNLPR